MDLKVEVCKCRRTGLSAGFYKVNNPRYAATTVVTMTIMLGMYLMMWYDLLDNVYNRIRNNVSRKDSELSNLSVGSILAASSFTFEFI